MTARLSSAFTSCSTKTQSESVEVITSDNDLNESRAAIDEDATMKEAVTQDGQPQPSFLWRVSSGAIGGVYNAATGAAGMGYNTTKWVLGKGVEVGSNVAVASKDLSGSVLTKTAEMGTNIVGKLPVPAKLKSKDKKE